MRKPGANLTLSALKKELPKAKSLAAKGLVEDYIILTNAGVSGDAEQVICEAFQGQGVKKCGVFDDGWIVQQLNESTRLRMLVPRIYGIGDLSHLVTDHAYNKPRPSLTTWVQI